MLTLRSRCDYFAFANTVVLRKSPSVLHEAVLLSVTDDLRDQQRKIGRKNDQAGKFAREIECIGSADINFENRSEHSPDQAYGHKSASHVSAVVEIAYSQTIKGCERTAQSYLRGSNGEIRVLFSFNSVTNQKRLR